MKDKLNRALTNIDESLIEEAANANCAEHKMRNMVVKIAIPIGAAAAVVGAVLIAQPYTDAQHITSGITLNAGAQNSESDKSDSQANNEQNQTETDNLQAEQEHYQAAIENFQSEQEYLQEQEDLFQAQKNSLNSEMSAIQEEIDIITKEIANDKLSKSEKEKLQAELETIQAKKYSIQAELDNLESEMDIIQAKQNEIAQKKRSLERSKRIDKLFGEDYSEGQTAGITADGYTLSSIFFDSFSPAVLMYENDIAVFTDGSDSILCFYDTADDTPDNERMIAQIDLPKTVELLQNDPENGILPTIGSEELGYHGTYVGAYNINGKRELVLNVVSTDGEEMSVQYFDIHTVGSNVVFSRRDKVSGDELERITQSDEITTTLVDGCDMYSLRLVVNKNGKSRVFDPFNEMYEYLPENYSGISISFAQGGLRPKVYVYDINALKEGGQWYFTGEGFYNVDYCSISIYESGINTVEINFTENGDGSIFISDITIPKAAYDNISGEYISPESHFPVKKFEAGTDCFMPADTAVCFEKWGAERLGLIEKAKADFPMLKNINIEYRFSEYDTRLYFTAVSSEEITPQQDEDIRYWLYQNTGENHPIVEILTADTQIVCTDTRFVYPLAHYDYDTGCYVPNDNPDFDYRQSQIIPTDEPTPVLNVAEGEVMYVGWYFNYGFVTVIKHDGFSTMYYHLNHDGFYNNVGVNLPAGYLIGETGTSGYTNECSLGYFYIEDEDFYLKVKEAVEKQAQNAANPID